jgi:DnaD/phage-associated family protein
MSATAIIKESALFGYTRVEDGFILEKLPMLSGDAVKVYLYALMLAHKGAGAADELPNALSMNEEQVEAAYSELERAGALRIIYGENGSYAVQLIRLSGGETALSAAEARRYSSLIEKLRGVLGTRNFSGSDLKKIYDWIEVFRFEEDAAVEIVRGCIAVKGTRVHINYMDAVAKRLAADGLLSAEEVKHNFEHEAKLSGGAGAILKHWNKRRAPTENELELYERWTGEWGFTEEAIGIAAASAGSYGSPSFILLNSILSDYRESGSVDADRLRELSREHDMIEELMREALKRSGIKTVNANTRSKFTLWIRDYRFDRELILYAAELSVNKHNPFSYMNKLLADWHGRGIASFQAAREDTESRAAEAALPENAAKGKRVNRAQSYKQRRYTTDQLKALGIDFGEDVYNDDED